MSTYVYDDLDDCTNAQAELAILCSEGPGDPGCVVCHGTGWDAAFEASCFRCDGSAPIKARFAITNTAAPSAPETRRIEETIDLAELAAWLLTQTWSEFAVSLGRQYEKRGSLSEKQVGAAKAMRAKCEARSPKTEASAKAPVVVAAGFYVVDDTAYKVQAAKSTGNLYAMPLNPEWGRFEYESGAIRLVRESGVRMTLEQAAAYGRRTGRCCVCGRELTDTESIAAGIGPVCKAKF
jgi:hypothetical protein